MSYEAAHGTVQRHLQAFKGRKTTNKTLLQHCLLDRCTSVREAKMDCLDDSIKFADNLEKATIQTIEEGVMTGDPATLFQLLKISKVDTEALCLQ